MLAESEEMPLETLIRLAHRIKPLMRPKEGSKLQQGLYWTKPEPLTQSFYFNFTDSSVLKNQNDEILMVETVEKVCEFVCFHRYGGYYGFLRPGMDEIIQQFPSYLLADEKAEYAVELVFPSLELRDIYDAVLDRHVSTVKKRGSLYFLFLFGDAWLTVYELALFIPHSFLLTNIE